MGRCLDFFSVSMQTQVQFFSIKMMTIWKIKVLMTSCSEVSNWNLSPRLSAISAGFYVTSLCSTSLTLQLLTLRWLILFDVHLLILPVKLQIIFSSSSNLPFSVNCSVHSMTVCSSLSTDLAVSRLPPQDVLCDLLPVICWGYFY